MHVILLTTTIQIRGQLSVQNNAQARKSHYLQVIQNYLQHTNLRIVVIENSGLGFPELQPHPNLEVIVYDFHQLPVERQVALTNGKQNKGNFELDAIDWALNHAKFLSDSKCFVIKVTGRYYVPQLATLKLPTHVEALAQFDPTRCEIIGCQRRFVSRLFCFPQEDDHVEKTYERRLRSLRTLRLPLLSIDRTQMGSGEWITTL